MSVVSQVILKADDELRYPSSGELQGIGQFLKTGEQRIRIAETLADNEKKIVDQAQKQLFKKRPDYRAPGMYNSLNVPVPGMVEAIRCLKEAALGLLTQEDAVEAAPYFDFIIQYMS